MTTKEIKYISHAKLQGIFEQLLEGIALIDAETLKITCCNPAFYKMFDYSLADVLQLNLPELHLEDDWTRVSTEYKQFLHEINYVAINTRFKRRDDTSFYADVTTTPLMVEERLYWLFVVRDSNQRDQEHKISCMLSDLKYRVLFENSSDALMLFKPPSWHFFEANQSALDLFGVPTLDAFIKLGPWDISPLHQPDGELSADKAQKMIKTAMQKGTHSFTWHHITTQNHTFYADVLLTKIELGDEAFLQASVRNITERYQLARLEAEMRVMSESEEKFRLISENAHDAIVMMDADKCISFWNTAAERLFGYTKAEVIGQEMHPLLAPEANDAFKLGFERFQQTGTGAVINKVLELKAHSKDGSILDVEVTVSPICINGFWSALGIFRDITEHKIVEEKIRQMALYDQLTDLPNRRLLHDRLKQAMDICDRSKRYGAVMFIDLDAFKAINDLHGHDMGDLLLKEVGVRITSCLRKTDTVARFGGDEFVVLLCDLAENKQESLVQVNEVAEKICVSLAKKYEFYKTYLVEYSCSASIGATVFSNHDYSAENLLKWADRAMYAAKNNGGNQVSLIIPPVDV